MNDRIDALAFAAMTTSDNELEAFYAKLDPKDVSDVQKRLEGIAQRAAYAETYLGTRLMGGMPAQADKRSHAKLKKVRKAMGFTYP